MKMSVEQIVEELKAVRDSFNNEYDACPVCIIEAIRVLESLIGRKEEEE